MPRPRSGNREGLTAYLAAGHQGEMDWMETRKAERADPADAVAEARSAIVLGLNYGPERDPLEILRQRESGAISSYALGEDYHDVVKKKLKAVAGFIFENATGAEVKVFVDTAPVMEKPLAQKAGLGWQGKHTNLVSREFGSWLFLGSIFTTLELPPDAREDGSLRQLPAHAWMSAPPRPSPRPIRLDARRCISYLTIEHKGPIPREFRAAMGNRIYGCDDCLAVCPWNKFAQASAGIEIPCPRGIGGAIAGGAGARWTMRGFAPCSANRRSSASAATDSSEMS